MGHPDNWSYMKKASEWSKADYSKRKKKSDRSFKARLHEFCSSQKCRKLFSLNSARSSVPLIKTLSTEVEEQNTDEFDCPASKIFSMRLLTKWSHYDNLIPSSGLPAAFQHE